MPIRAALRALLVAVLAALTLTPTVATPTPQADALVHVYTYDGHHPTVSSTYAITERGPPVENVNLTVYNADGPRPLGALACPERMGGPTSYNYDDTRRSVQSARGSQPVERPIGHERAKHAVDERWRVAANAGRGALNLPFKDPALRSQVDDVVRHFDDFGAPPPGVAQGGLKGYPKGTYGNKNGALPNQPTGYYTETDIWTSGNGIKRGAERLILGRNGEVFYTSNHYELGSFVRIR